MTGDADEGEGSGGQTAARTDRGLGLEGPEEIIDVSEESRRERLGRTRVHPWFAQRTRALGRETVALTLLRDGAAYATWRSAGGKPGELLAAAGLPDDRAPCILDLFSGTATIAGAAAGLGCEAEALELNPVAHQIARATWEFPATHERLADDVESLAGAAWRRTGAAVASLFDDAVAYGWLVERECPGCKLMLPESSARLFGSRVGVELRQVGDRAEVFVVSSGSNGSVCPRCGWQPERVAPSVGVEVLAGAWATSDLSSWRHVDRDWVARRATVVTETIATSGLAGNTGLERFVGAGAQSAVLAVLAGAVDAEVRDLDRRAGSTRAAAAAEALAVCLSGISDYARPDVTFRDGRGALPAGRYDARPVRRPRPHVEPGLAIWQRVWASAAQRFAAQVRHAAAQPGRVRARRGNATALPYGDECFDAVVCDPPFFDNVQYADASEPYLVWMSLVLTPLVGRGELPAAAPRAEELVMHRGAREHERARERELYERRLRDAVGEAARVLRPDRCLSVLFTVRDAGQLADFLALIQREGLELTEVVRIAQDELPVTGRDGPRSYVLLLRKSRGVAAIDAPVADAERVLDLADAGRLTLGAAVAEILDAEWEQEDLDAKLPADYAGTRSQRIRELVAAHPEPAELLVELGARALRRHARERDVPEAARGGDAQALARELMRAVGFSMPSPPAFSLHAQVDQVRRAAARATLTDDQDALEALLLSAAKAVQRVVRFATVAWLIAVRGDAWPRALGELFESGSDKPFTSGDDLSHGEWKRVFCALPTLVALAGELEPCLRELQKAIGKPGRVQEQLDKVIAARNSVAHDKDALRALPADEQRRKMLEALAAAERALGVLSTCRGMPRVLVPIEERRDRFGRLRLLAHDDADRPVEIHVAAPTDLTEPLLWFASGANPREVEPTLLPMRPVAEGCGFSM